MVTVVTDPIADMLTRIRNAVAVGHERVAMPSSKLKVNIAQILVDEGFIDRYEVVDNGHRSDLELVLRYAERRRPVIEGLKRVSRPGHRGAGASPCPGWARRGGRVHEPGPHARP
jgi:small subunit ribosomal protein S8